MVVVGRHFTFLLIVIWWEIPTYLLNFMFLLPFQRQPCKDPCSDWLIPREKDSQISDQAPAGARVALQIPADGTLWARRQGEGEDV